MVLSVMRGFLILAAMLAAAGQARAQDEAVQRAYAAIAERTQAEYEYNMAGITRQLLRAGGAVGKLAPIRERTKMLTYNRSVLFALCAAEAEKERMPGAPPVSPERNLVLTTCVDVKIGHLSKFAQLAAYADFFFPERIAPCGEESRLPNQDKMPAPYPFLQIDEPKLYDFPHYNECLMRR